MRDIRDQTIYHVLLDRFADSDPSNNQGHDPETFDPTRTNPHLRWGGDIQGLLDKLEYVASLGITCLRLSPIFEQMHGIGLDRGRPGAAWDGKWPRDWRRIDQHLLPASEWDRPFGARDTALDRLLNACHARGIRVVLDFVCDHSNPGSDRQQAGEMWDDGRWLLSADHDPEGWYARGPRREEHDNAGIDRFDARNAGFLQHIVKVLCDWTDRGVDGFCFLNVQRMPLWFWQQISSTMYARRPGLMLLGVPPSGTTWQDSALDFANHTGLHLVDFAFHRHIVESLCWNDVGGMRRIGEYLDKDDRLDDATGLVTLIDAPDTTRLLSSGLPEDQLLLAITLLMTVRGTPCIQYGTEQALKSPGDPDARVAPMMDRFDPSAPVARAVRRLAALRRDNLALQRGYYRTLWVSDDVLVFSRTHDQEHVVVALNRGRDIEVRVDNVPLPDGPAIDLLGGAGSFVRDRAFPSLRMPRNSAQVFVQEDHLEAAGTVVVFRINGYATRFGERIVLTGDAPELGSWDLGRAVRLQFVNANLWIGEVAFAWSVGKRVAYQYVVLDDRGNAIRERRLPRLRDVPSISGVEWQDRWG